MHRWMVADGVGPEGTSTYGKTYWVAHIFLPADARPALGSDFTSLCGKEFGAINYTEYYAHPCLECENIALRLGARLGPA